MAYSRSASGSRRTDTGSDALSASVISRALFEVRDDNRNLMRAQRAELGNRHLKVGQDFEQEGLELGLGAIDLVDQRTDAAPDRRARKSGRGSRNFEKKASSSPVGFTASRRLVVPAKRSPIVAQHLGIKKLLGIRPLVQRPWARRVLRNTASGSARGSAWRRSLWLAGLATAGRSFDEQRFFQAVGQIDRGGDALVSDIALRGEAIEHLLHPGEPGLAADTDMRRSMTQGTSPPSPPAPADFDMLRPCLSPKRGFRPPSQRRSTWRSISWIAALLKDAADALRSSTSVAEYSYRSPIW